MRVPPGGAARSTHPSPPTCRSRQIRREEFYIKVWGKGIGLLGKLCPFLSQSLPYNQSEDSSHYQLSLVAVYFMEHEGLSNQLEVKWSVDGVKRHGWGWNNVSPSTSLPFHRKKRPGCICEHWSIARKVARKKHQQQNNSTAGQPLPLHPSTAAGQKAQQWPGDWLLSNGNGKRRHQRAGSPLEEQITVY